MKDEADKAIGLNEKEFEALFRQHFKQMVFHAQRYVKDADTAREITHDAFIALWANRTSIDTSRSVVGWLSATIHNKCLNHLRDNRKFDRYLLAFENLAIETDQGYDHLVSGEITAEIYKAIEELPEKCREIFMLNRFEEKKYREIADSLSISVKTVETQMSKALQHLRTRLLPYLKMLLMLFV